MKTKILILLFFISTLIMSQWVQQSVPTGQFLRSASFQSGTTGWAAGYGGVILKTTNGGSAWVMQSSTVSQNLYSIHFPAGGNMGIAVGDNSVILRTSNGGTNWTLLFPAGGPLHLYAVNFIDALSGWMTGIQYTYNTTNSGLNWTLQYPPSSNAKRSIIFPNNLTGYSCGDNGEILKTTDAGIHWTPQTSGTSVNLNCICASNILTLWSVGLSGTILKTSNGGSNWIAQTSGTAAHLMGVYFINNSTGWAVGNGGQIRVTTNGGTNWASQPSGVSDLLYSVTFPQNGSTGYITGANGIILKTTNGGFTGIENISNDVPEKFSLSQNYPNPFNPETNIEFSIQRTGNVKMEIYDIPGKRIRTLVNEQLKAGNYKVDFDGTNIPSGVYFYRLETESFSDTKKMILVK